MARLQQSNLFKELSLKYMIFPEMIWFVVDEIVGVLVFSPFFTVAAGSGGNFQLYNIDKVSSNGLTAIRSCVLKNASKMQTLFETAIPVI